MSEDAFFVSGYVNLYKLLQIKNKGKLQLIPKTDLLN